MNMTDDAFLLEKGVAFSFLSHLALIAALGLVFTGNPHAAASRDKFYEIEFTAAGDASGGGGGGGGSGGGGSAGGGGGSGVTVSRATVNLLAALTKDADPSPPPLASPDVVKPASLSDVPVYSASSAKAAAARSSVPSSLIERLETYVDENATGIGEGGGSGIGSGSGSGIGSGSGSGIGAGSGSGIGSGTGTGIGAGTGSGIGAGAGSGIGSGTGSGIGSGSGSGVGTGAGTARAAVIERFVRQVEKNKGSYPYFALRQHKEGISYIYVKLAADGSLAQHYVTASAGEKSLDDAALKAIGNSCPFPHGLGGELVITVPVRWTIN
jgi:TonB family protein